MRLKSNNENVGGGTVDDGSEMLLVHGVGRTVNLNEIEDIVITSEDGVRYAFEMLQMFSSVMKYAVAR